MKSEFTHKGLTVSASDVMRAYTANKSAAFIIALIFTLLFNYTGSMANELTKNEFLPSVKDVIAGFYPNKAIFQILIALCSCFQLIVSVILYICFCSQSIPFANILGVISIFRLISFLSFAYITAEDDIWGFNNSFVLYLLSNFAWIYFIQTRVSSRSKELNQLRRRIKNVYLGSLVAATVFFYRHQVEKVDYAYSISSLFQWILIGLDILFDSLFEQETRIISLNVDFPEGNMKKHIV